MPVFFNCKQDHSHMVYTCVFNCKPHEQRTAFASMHTGQWHTDPHPSHYTEKTCPQRLHTGVEQHTDLQPLLKVRALLQAGIEDDLGACAFLHQTVAVRTTFLHLVTLLPAWCQPFLPCHHIAVLRRTTGITANSGDRHRTVFTSGPPLSGAQVCFLTYSAFLHVLHHGCFRVISIFGTVHVSIRTAAGRLFGRITTSRHCTDPVVRVWVSIRMQLGMLGWHRWRGRLFLAGIDRWPVCVHAKNDQSRVDDGAGVLFLHLRQSGHCINNRLSDRQRDNRKSAAGIPTTQQHQVLLLASGNSGSDEVLGNLDNLQRLAAFMERQGWGFHLTDW